MGRPTPTVEDIQPASPGPAWSPQIRILFRFCFVYLSLYALATQILGGLLLYPNFSFPAFGTSWPMLQVTTWCATHIFGVTPPLVHSGNSGDTAFYWVQTFWLLVVALIATGIWSDFDRGQTNYATLHKWFRLFVRFALASQMFDYGMAKVIPTQFPAPSLVTLVEPVGHLSLTDMLWTSIGASPAYQMFTGWVEMLGGLLLIIPRTTLLGGLISAACMVEVFVLNMTYDFGLKQISFHLFLFSLFLIAPDVDRLLDLFLRDRVAAPPSDPALFSTRRANRNTFVAQMLLAAYLLAMYANISRNYWYNEGEPGSPKSPLYGIWNVEQLAVDGEVRSPLENDYDRRWRRVIFDSTSVIAFQRTDDSIAHYGGTVDESRRTISLKKGNSRTWESRFTYERPTEDRLTLDGDMDGYRIHAQLQRVDLDTFRLLGSRFRWVRPPDPSGG